MGDKREMLFAESQPQLHKARYRRANLGLSSREPSFGQSSPTRSPCRQLATYSQMPALVQSTVARVMASCNVQW